MARVIENSRSFKGLVFFEQGAKGYGGLTIIVRPPYPFGNYYNYCSSCQGILCIGYSKI